MADDDGGDSVQVAVRVRIFNGREKNASAQRIIRMRTEEKGSRTYITNPETGDEKEFKFDYSFNSHLDDPEVGPYATQDTVFNQLGRPVMNMALEGRNVCLFAYGQTGAGKSFSMLGKTDIPELQGIIPRTCKEIFRIIDENKGNPLIKATVSIQVVEIYCEMVNDLLADRKTWPPGGFKPRLTKDGYTCDTVSKPCMNFEDIESAFKFADRNRSVGSHALNPESSRAHTIYTIRYERKSRESETAQKETVVTSKINLVDLAGSERTESAGTSGQMLREGNAINLSLTALGNCIHALSEGKRPGFRDSKLTLLLQGSMTNGRVIMIAAVSPASICYDESISTLRFAERIKMVKIKSKKNVTVDPVEEIKKEMEAMRTRMQQEIDELRAGGATTGGGGGGKGDDGQSAEELERLKTLLQEQKDAEDALRRDMERQLEELKQTDEQRKQNADKISENWKKALGGATDEAKEDITVPHLLNLNPEEALAETLVYKLEGGVTSVGRSNKEKPPKLEFSGMGMLKDHCTFKFDEETKKVMLEVTAPGARVMLNGEQLGDQPVEVKHNARVWLGNNYAFRFAFPGEEGNGDAFDGEQKADYFYAEQEIAEKNAAQSGEPSALNHKLSEALKKVEQANIIAGDLTRECVFQPKIVTDRATGESKVVVYLQMPQGNLTWPWDKFNVRLVDMVKQWEAWQYAQNNDAAFSLPPDEENPFVDVEHQLVGEADVWLQSLGNMVEFDFDPPVLNVTGQREGQIKVNIVPLDKNGGEGPWDDDDMADLDPFVEAPEELLKKEVQFAVKIPKVQFDVDLAQGAKFRDTFVRYKIHPMDEHYVSTAHDASAAIDPKYDHVHKAKVFVDENFLRHITKGKITFQVWGKLLNDPPKSSRTMRTILPDGWKKVTAYMDTEGNLHKDPPKVGDMPPPV